MQYPANNKREDAKQRNRRPWIKNDGNVSAYKFKIIQKNRKEDKLLING